MKTYHQCHNTVSATPTVCMHEGRKRRGIEIERGREWDREWERERGIEWDRGKGKGRRGTVRQEEREGERKESTTPPLLLGLANLCYVYVYSRGVKVDDQHPSTYQLYWCLTRFNVHTTVLLPTLSWPSCSCWRARATVSSLKKFASQSVGGK